MRTRIARATIVAAAALGVAGSAGGRADAQSIFDRLNDVLTGSSRVWQGSWGVDGRTPVVVVSGWNVAYQGTNRQQFAVSNVAINDARITFQAGRAVIVMTRRTDSSVDFVSTIGDHSSAPIVLCRSDAPSCP
jgi:hypothetical protein